MQRSLFRKIRRVLPICLFKGTSPYEYMCTWKSYQENQTQELHKHITVTKGPILLPGTHKEAIQHSNCEESIEKNCPLITWYDHQECSRQPTPNSSRDFNMVYPNDLFKLSFVCPLFLSVHLTLCFTPATSMTSTIQHLTLLIIAQINSCLPKMALVT